MKHLPPAIDAGNDILTRSEAATFLKVTTRTLDRMRRKGVIKPFQSGKIIRFTRGQLLALFQPIAA